MLSNLAYVNAATDRLLVNLAGIETITEVIHRATDGPSSSSLMVTFSGVQISGMISYLYYEVYDGNVWATNNVQFITVPSGLDTITIAGVKYTFVSVLSGLNNVPIQTTPENQAVALFRVVNAMGASGTDFWAGQIANPYVSGIFPDNPLTFRAIASGIGGNILGITTSSPAVKIVNQYFTGGRATQLTSPSFFGCTSSGMNSPNGSRILLDVPYSSVGEAYLVHTWFANTSGLQALDSSGNPSSYWVYSPFFTGRMVLPYYAEVSGLSGVNLVGGSIPSNGQVGLNWMDVSKWFARSGQIVYFAFPYAPGVQTRATGSYSYTIQGEKVDYIVFVFQSTSGTAPEEPWPRAVDANGTWYYAGKTSRTAATLYLPPESTSKFSIWVGFGNKDTRTISGTSTGTPFNSVSPSIYIL